MKALLTKATDAVRTLILSSAPPEKRQAVSDLLRECLKSGALENAVTSVSAAARNAVYELKEKGKLNEDALLDFSKKRMFGETVVALALLTAMPIERVESQMHADQHATLIIMCKSIDLKWPTVAMIMFLRENPPTPPQLKAANTDYSVLSVESALRAMRFFYAKQSILNR
jgi:hypothetical protein